MSVVTIIGAGVKALEGVAATAVPDLVEALRGADFVQENGPERIEVKRELFAAAAEHTSSGAVLASSSSSLLPSVLAEGNHAADRIVIGHPFNPPELMPLVEVVPSPETSAATMDRAVEVYLELGRRPVRLKREIPGLVGNRLQKVFSEQATYLVQQGVIEPEELDRLVRNSLGLRWATIGPFESRHLGGGPGGIRQLAAHVGSQMRFENGSPDPALNPTVFDAVEAAYGVGEEVYEKFADQRDRRTRAVLGAPEDADRDEKTR